MIKNLEILFFITVLTGCIFPKNFYNYSINAKNSGQQMIDDVEITSSNGFWHETGYISKNAMKGLGGPQSVPPNDIYTIVVERKDRPSTKKILDLRDQIRKGFRGDIIFLINDHNQICYELKPY